MESIWCPSIVTIDDSEDCDQCLYVFLSEYWDYQSLQMFKYSKRTPLETHTNTFPVYGYSVLHILLNSTN